MTSLNTSCIILNYNDWETAQKLLLAIQDCPSLDSIVVVDNCSTDDSFERLKQYESKNVHVLSSGRNGGYGFGNNVGMRYAMDELDAQCCLIANPDVLFSNEVVEGLKAFMQAHDDCAIVTATQNGNTARSCWCEASVGKHLLFDSIILNTIFKPRYYPSSYFESKDFAEVFAVSGCFFLARIKAMKDIDFYDEEFFLFEEEACVGTKLKAANWKTYIIPGLNFLHMHGVSINKNFKNFGASKKIVLKSNDLFLRKYKGVPERKMKAIRVYYKLCVAEQAVWDFIRFVIHR